MKGMDMVRGETKALRVPTGVFLGILMAFAALPPLALILMQKEARRPVPYLTIDLTGEQVAIHQQAGSDTLPLGDGS